MKMEEFMEILQKAFQILDVETLLLFRLDLIYYKKDPLEAVLLLNFWCVISCFILGYLTGEYSWVDRIWSITPFVYTWMFALHPVLTEDLPISEFYQSRAFLLVCLTTLWGIRLTLNFVRRGGYSSGGEDYRWVEVRKWFSPFVMELFNFTFISFYQNILLMWIAMPSYTIWQNRYSATSKLNVFDVILTLAFLFFLVLETVTDQQTEKYRRIKNKEPLGDEFRAGFCQTGVFRYSRHLNFFSEQCIWWVVFGFGCISKLKAPISSLNDLFDLDFKSLIMDPTILGAIQLSLLFQGSTGLTENITAKKYPKYKIYQRTTSRLIPWFPSKEKIV